MPQLSSRTVKTQTPAHTTAIAVKATTAVMGPVSNTANHVVMVMVTIARLVVSAVVVAAIMGTAPSAHSGGSYKKK